MNINKPSTVLESSTSFIDDTRSSIAYTRNLSSIDLGFNDIRQGNSVANYKDLIAKHGNASSAYYRQVLNDSAPGQCKYEAVTPDSFNKQFGYGIKTGANYVFHGVPIAPSTNDTETRNRALASLKRQLSSRIASAKSMAPIAECKELGRLVEQAAWFTSRFVQSVAEAKLRKSGKPLKKFLADSWLGLNFGLLPMINDIDQIGKAIAAHIQSQDKSFRIQGSATSDSKLSYTPSHSLTPPFGGKFVLTGESYAVLSYRFIGAFSAKLSASNDYSLMRRLGLGLGDIPAAAWELTGYSWLIDYFTNIGEYLQDTFYVPPGTVSYLVEDRKLVVSAVHTLKVDLIRDWTGSNPNGLVLQQADMAISRFSATNFKRTPLIELPHAGLVWKSNQTKAKYAVSKLLNLLAVKAK